MAKERTRYGSGKGIGAASLDIVIMEIPLGREFTQNEVDDEVQRRGLPKRGAAGQHLRALRDRGFDRKSDNGWVRVR